MKKTVVIINAHASRVRRQRRNIKKVFAKPEFKDIEVRFVDDPKHLNREIKKVLTLNPDIIVFGGGDGTIIGGIQYALKHDYKKSFAMLPLGTSNYLARNLDIPLSTEAALKTILSGKTHKLHFGSANGSLFSLMATIGITTSVSENVTVETKQKIGQMAYLVETVRQLFIQDSFEYEITIPGTQPKVYCGKSHQLAVINANVSQQLKFIPDSSLHDPRLRITMYTSGTNRFKVLLSVIMYCVTLGKVKKGQIDLHTKEAKITTSPIQTVAVDGEVVAKTPVSIEVFKTPIKIVY